MMGYDKNAARNKKQRIAENTLLFWAFLGGSFGFGMGMWVFKHKTSKKSFLWKFYGIVVVQLLGLTLYCKNVIGVY
jgi:uncharacterized membrane protein YsdA (DUF1294 family)